MYLEYVQSKQVVDNDIQYECVLVSKQYIGIGYWLLGIGSFLGENIGIGNWVKPQYQYPIYWHVILVIFWTAVQGQTPIETFDTMISLDFIVKTKLLTGNQRKW